MKEEIFDGKMKKQKSYDILNLNNSKELDLEEFYKNMNIEQISEHLKKEKIEEIKKFVEKEKEEEEILKDFNDVEQEEIEIDNNENKIIEDPKIKDDEEEEENNLSNNIILIKEKEEDNLEKNNNNINEGSMENKDSPNKQKSNSIKDNININNINTNIKKTEKKSIIQTSKNSNLVMKKKNELFLNTINISEKENNENLDTFCEIFFIASFSKEKGKIIKNSETFMPDCKHSKCSLLPAMSSEIIYKYP